MHLLRAQRKLYLGYWHGLRGERAERTTAINRALELDPLSHFVHSIAGLSYIVTREYDEVVALCQKGLALDPNSIPCWWASAVANLFRGQVETATRNALRSVELSQRGPILLGTLGLVLAKADRRDEALEIRAELEKRAATEYVGPVSTLYVDIGLGDEALLARSLERTIEAESGPTSLSVGLIPDLDRLLDDARFGPLVRRLSLYAGR